MSTFLFDTIIFGPVWSRRLGESLGINLLPAGYKICNFNCVYCECGLTQNSDDKQCFPGSQDVKESLEIKLLEMKRKGAYLDCITFAGNGEPTLHPAFPLIIDETIEIRNRIFPSAKIAVLSNATMINNKRIFNALLKADLNILKLDSAIETTLSQINCPQGKYQLPQIEEALKQFKGKLIIQTLFLRGNCNGNLIDNTTEDELSAWLNMLSNIRPESVMIYSLARDTALHGLEKVDAEELNRIAERIEKLGIDAQVTP